MESEKRGRKKKGGDQQGEGSPQDEEWREEEDEDSLDPDDAPSPPPPDEEEILEDITEEFVEACKAMKQGELAHVAGFQLIDAMSAIELMDPKMDSGMVKMREMPTVEDAIVEEWLLMADDEVLATVDATFAALATWLEGNMLSQTLLTNLLITDPDAITCAITNGIIPSNPSTRTMEALAHGMAHLILLVRHSVQTAAVFEEEDFCPSMPFAVTSSLSVDELMKLFRGAEATVDKVAKSSKARALTLQAVHMRLGWLRNTLQGVMHLVVPRVDDYAQGRNAAFRPKLKAAFDCLVEAVEKAELMPDTAEIGKMAPNGQDGDYGWLRAFVPDLNKRFLPASFPRKATMLSRRIGLSFLTRMTRRFLDIAKTVPGVVTDCTFMLSYLQRFCEIESCVLSRSVLQLVLFPNDERILGDVHMEKILRDTIAAAVAPPVMFIGSPSQRSEKCMELFDEFCQDAVRVLLPTVQALGCNLARQREKLAVIFDDFAQMQKEAEKVDSECTHITEDYSRANEHEFKGPDPGPQLSTFWLTQILKVVRYHFELGFRLSLYSNYELPFMFWYMRDVVCKWQASTVERSQNLLLAEHTAALQQEQVAPGKQPKTSKANKLIEKFRKRMSIVRAAYTYGEEAIFHAYFRLCVGLTVAGKIIVPEWMPGVSSGLRVAHRMAPFVPLSHPIHVTFDDFIYGSGYQILKDAGQKASFDEAARMFEVAKDSWEKSTDARLNAMARICRQNMVVCKILGSGARPNCKIEFDFTDTSFPCYPLLKLT